MTLRALVKAMSAWQILGLLLLGLLLLGILTWMTYGLVIALGIVLLFLYFILDLLYSLVEHWSGRCEWWKSTLWTDLWK